LDSSSIARIRRKKVALIDDVVTTGGNMRGLERLVKMSNGEICARACIWIEGFSLSQEARKTRKGLIYLDTLPEFFTKERLAGLEAKYRVVDSG
jgi:adenine phosphoribosyltransferase